VSSTDQVAERGATWSNNTLFEQPSVCSSAQGLGPRRAASKGGEVVEQALPLDAVAAYKAEVAANALEMRPAGLLVARVVDDEHRQQAQQWGQHVEHRRGYLACVRQEVATPAQHAQLHAEAQLVGRSSTALDLVQVGARQAEVLP
jgi:hypothetical protein